MFYGLGNFVCDLDADALTTLGPGPFETAVALITLAPSEPPAVELRPAYIDVAGNHPRPATLRPRRPPCSMRCASCADQRGVGRSVGRARRLA